MRIYLLQGVSMYQKILQELKHYHRYYYWLPPPLLFSYARFQLGEQV
jgi:hypothetical protein